jgi:hypothetical protein
MFSVLDPVKSYTVQSGSIEDDIEEYEKEIEKCLQASVDSTQRSAQQLTTSEKLAEGTMQVCFHLSN